MRVSPRRSAAMSILALSRNFSTSAAVAFLPLLVFEVRADAVAGLDERFGVGRVCGRSP